MLIIPTEKRFDWKHAPIVLFILVILNTIIYFGYQFDDDKKIFNALINYKEHNFIEKEWPIYQDYLKANNESIRLEADKELYKEMSIPNNEFRLLFNIVSDRQFYQYLENNSYDLFYLSFIEKWSIPRLNIHKEISSVSSIALGLIPKELGVISLITHQFLHGGIMHLLGNMFFLIICGFAVEAAIGHMRFLLFYLISGIGGGVLFTFMDPSSLTPLVGASGSISGVMAMYLGVFRLKKIEFFYWFFIFVGYIRAPALLILPFYIGKELYSYLGETGSNVAFMAHTGGFITGGVLMALTYFIKPEVLNVDYIEENQDLPKLQKDLEKVYKLIERSRFKTAINALNIVIKEHGNQFEWLLLKFKLLKMQNNPAYKESLIDLITMERLNPQEIDKLTKVWQSLGVEKTEIAADNLYKFGWNLTNNTHYELAEKIFAQLFQENEKHPNLGMYAKKLSVIFGKMKNNEKKQQYELVSDKLILGFK